MRATIVSRARTRTIVIVLGALLSMASGFAASSAHRHYDIEARLDAPALRVSASGRYDVSAKLADAPRVCFADLIFRDGFEGVE